MYLNIIYSKMHFCMEVLVILNGRRVFLKIYIYLYQSVWYTSFGGNYKNGVHCA